MISTLDFQKKLTNRLLIWSGSSIVSGSILVFLENQFLKGFGIQAIIWGIIDAFIALIGKYNIRKKSSSLTSSEQLVKEAGKLRRVLLINTFLDIFYVAFGAVLAFVSKDLFWQGNGIGIVVQGAFLFFFDLIHKLLIKE
ncbi:MAG: DUF6992 family protein [Candidatus Poribacteria bacterium]